MDNSNMIDAVKALLGKKDFENAKFVFDCKNNRPALLEWAGEIFPYICSYLVDKTINDHEFAILETLMDFYIINGSSKELLMYVLAAIEEKFSEPLSAIVLLIPLQRLLLRIPEKRGTTLHWVVSSLSTLVKNLQLPSLHNYEGEERKLLDLDPEVCDAKDVLESLIDFLKPFIEEVSLKNIEEAALTEKIIQQRKYLCSFILSVMGHPLAYLDLHHEHGEAESQIRRCAEKLVEYIAAMKGNIFSVMEESYKEFCSDKEDLSLPTLSYFLIGEEQRISIPLVFSPVHMFSSNVNHCIVLLNRTEDLLIHKGLLLTNGILIKIDNDQLSESVLDMAEVIMLPKCLFQVMIYCQVQEHRKKALLIFHEYISKLTLRGRCDLLNILLQNETHSGVRSLITNSFKDSSHRELCDPDNIDLIFGGRSLQMFIKRAITLPEEEKTDLLQNFDAILSSISFLRYLFIRDPKSVNRTQIWDSLEFIRDKFIEPLKLGLQLSKAHYELELKNSEDDYWKFSETNINASTNLGQNLPPLTKENHRDMCRSALTTFDLIHSVLACLENNMAS